MTAVEQKLGMPQHKLDEIELRLVGADHRPWTLDKEILDESGKPLICKGSRKARIKAEVASVGFADLSKYPPSAQKAEYQSALAEARSAASSQGRHLESCPTHIDPIAFRKALALFKLCDAASIDMAEFVAHAPEDIDLLLTEVKHLRMRLEKSERDREDFRKEMLSLRVEAAALREKLAEMRRAWKTLCGVMDPK